MNRSPVITDPRERSLVRRWLSDVRRARARRPRPVGVPTDQELRRRTVAAIEDDVAVRLGTPAMAVAADGLEAA